MILISDTDERGLQALANRLRKAIFGTTFCSSLEVTASVGFGMLNPTVSIDRNITQIDDALSQAAKSGRNCAVAASMN